MADAVVSTAGFAPGPSRRTGVAPADDLGQRLRRIRKAQGLSLATLGGRCGVSVSMLSHIERGQTMPSLKTLGRICEALAVEMPEVFPAREADADEPVEVVRGGARATLEFDALGLRKELLSPARGRTLEFFMMSLRPGGSSGPDPLSRRGEKGGLVLSGRLRLCVGSRIYVLEAGDSFQFDSSHPHRIVNETDAPVELVWIIRPDPVPDTI